MQQFNGANEFQDGMLPTSKHGKRRRLMNIAKAGTLENQKGVTTKNEKLSKHINKKLTNV
jgi:hypothetical protein